MNARLFSMDILACKDCDLLNSLPATDRRGTLICARCGAVLHRHRPDSLNRSLALILAALILFVIANSFPFLSIRSGAFSQETTLLTGVGELWRQQLPGLALLILLTCFLIPLSQMVGLLYILTPLKWRHPAPGARHVFRFIQHTSPWGMMEVFMLGILVALVKLGKLATIVPGPSVFAFGLLIFVVAAAVSALDPPLVWEKLDRRR